MRVHRFSYPAGAHSHWHVHLGEQGLFVVAGEGWIKFQGEERVKIGPGDLAYVPPRRPHWHGATAAGSFVHLAFTASGGTDWKGKVSKEQYEAGSD